MRRALRLLLLGSIVVWFVRRRRAAAGRPDSVAVGFADGSSTTLEAGSPERELILAAAGEALA